MSCLTGLRLNHFSFFLIIRNSLGCMDIQGYILLDTAASNFGINYPELQKLHDEVAAQPNIKKWLEARPKTEN